MADEIDNKATQLRKGILELAVMAALHGRTHYGYSLVRSLTGPVSPGIKEGTIYPILARLSREGLVKSHWIESSQGPPRKYYELTDAGRRACEALQEEFRRLVRLVEDAARPPAETDRDPADRKIAIRRRKDE